MKPQMHRHSKGFYPVNYLKSQAPDPSPKKAVYSSRSFLWMLNFPKYQNNKSSWMPKITHPFTFAVGIGTSESSPSPGLWERFLDGIRQVLLKLLIGILRFGFRVCKKLGQFPEWFYRFMDGFVMMGFDNTQVFPKIVQQKPKGNSSAARRDFLYNPQPRTNDFRKTSPRNKHCTQHS